MKQLTSGVDVRRQEAKYAFEFCEFLQKDFKIHTYGQGEVSIIFDEWVNKNVPVNVNWNETENIVYKTLGFNGYENFLFAIEDKNEEILNQIKWEIDYNYSQNHYLLSGDYNNIRFTKPVWNALYGIPLKYAKWCIEQRFKILNKRHKIK